jgi:hypothetical protein
MKKLALLLLCAGGIAASATAQSVRIGKLEFSVKKSQDTVVARLEEMPDEAPEKKPFKRFHKSLPFGGIGFIMPNVGGGSYTTLGGKSISLDFGWLHRYQVTPRFALLLSPHYSYRNYKLHDAASEPLFIGEVIGKAYAEDGIKKQVFRSHNAALGGWVRFYVVEPRRHRNGGVFVDLGVQLDWAFSKHYTVFPYGEKKQEYSNDYAFNAFPVSATVRAGFWQGSAIFARYRFTNAFNQKALPLDLPRVTIGIQFL